MKKIFITGGAGFIGSHISEQIFLTFKKSKIIIFDKLTYAGKKNYISNIIKSHRVKFIKGDFFEKEVVAKITTYFNCKIDIVLSDMAANTTGNKNLDSFRTGELCLNGMELSRDLLSKDGIFLAKIFMGSIFKEIYINAKKHFKNVVNYKPLSSKKDSKEIYIFCKGVLKYDT